LHIIAIAEAIKTVINTAAVPFAGQNSCAGRLHRKWRQQLLGV